jgi:hypothetical protein
MLASKNFRNSRLVFIENGEVQEGADRASEEVVVDLRNRYSRLAPGHFLFFIKIISRKRSHFEGKLGKGGVKRNLVAISVARSIAMYI